MTIFFQWVITAPCTWHGHGYQILGIDLVYLHSSSVCPLSLTLRRERETNLIYNSYEMTKYDSID